jgi:hypothetical protein
MAVEDALQSMESQLSFKQGSTMPEQRTKSFYQKVLHDNIWGIILRYLIERDKGGIIYPNGIN